MTDKLFFDTDCISSFLWVGEENILFKLYSGRIILPKQVYDELSNPCVPHFKRKVNQLCMSGDIFIKEIIIGTEEYLIYYELVRTSKGEKAIGKGEAAVIALAKIYNGILASNNLKDVDKYVKKYELEHITTSDILVSALDKGCINEKTGNQIWKDMIERRRKLPTKTFTDYLKIVKY